MNRLAKAFDRSSKAMDKRIGKPATYIQRTYDGVDVATGIQGVSEITKAVMLRPAPLSAHEFYEFAKAGITQIEARWFLRAHYMENVEPDDYIVVSGFKYKVLGQPPSVLDEFGIEWTIYTQRVRV